MATTYTIPSGLSNRQKKALAALLACSPCCGSGSGSGSGSGRARIPCCENALGSVTTASWSMTGSTCGCDGTEPTTNDCNIPLEFTYDPVALSSTHSVGITGVVCNDVVVTMSLCCIETASAGTFYRFGAEVSFTDGGGFTRAVFISDFFDVASCDLQYFEVANLEPVFSETFGTPACSLAGLKLSAVFS